jgi:protein involved in polysaccharide export with SLBB domain
VAPCILSAGAFILMVLAHLMGRYRYLFAAFLAAAACCAASAQLPEVPKVETSKQTNERIKTLSMGVHAHERDYLIGNGDLVEISVFDVPELSREIRVSQVGTLGIPLVPVRLQVAGLTEAQAEQKIAEVLEANGLVSHPEVSVVVKEHRSRPITIVGAVNHPMVYEADRIVTVLEVLAEAGGITQDASDTVIISRGKPPVFAEINQPVPVTPQSSSVAPGTAESISAEPPELDTAGNPVSAPAPAVVPQQNPPSSQPSPAFPSASDMPQQAPVVTEDASAPPIPVTDSSANAGSIITVNLNDLLEKGNMHNNIVLQAGDVITVPHAGIVYVLGAVNRPGGFVVSNDRSQFTTLKVLALAGGMTNIAKMDHAVLIRRDSQGKGTEVEVDLKKVITRQSEDVQMRPSDVLYIPDNRTKQILLRAAEIGLALGTAVAVFRLAYR